MGTLRFLLAFAVFNAHAVLPLGFSIVAGSTAVHCFFVISGFYMAMVLSEKYLPSGATYYDFVSSRLLRLAPSYLTVLAVTTVVAAFAAAAGLHPLPPFQSLQHLNESNAGALFHVLNALSQVSMLGQDVYSFLDWTPAAGFAFTPVHGEGNAGLNNLLIVPPAWSLSVEIYFYLLAPWLVRMRLPTIFTLIAASFLCRAMLAWQQGWIGDPWSYRFFPSELAFFLTGVLAYRLNAHASRRIVPCLATLLLLGGLLGLAETLGVWDLNMPVQRWARVPLFALLAAGIPVLFSLTRDWRLDRQIGELSYPLYVSHFLVIWIAGYVFADLSTTTARMALVASAVLVALALRRWVDLPVDRYRQKRLKHVEQPLAARDTLQTHASTTLSGIDVPASAGK